MSDDLIELNDTERNYVDFGDKTDSNNASNDSNEDFVLRKSLFHFKLISIVWTFEDFSIGDILPWKTHFVFPNVKFLCIFLTGTFVLYLCNFNITNKLNIAGIALLQKCKYFAKFPVLKIFKISYLFPNHFSRKF